RADEIRVLDDPSYDRNSPDHYRDRPVLGLRFGRTWYWNTHARNRSDAVRLLQTVRNFARTDGNNWVLLGDFNADIRGMSNAAASSMLGLGPGESLIRTGRPTYFNNNRPSELDYAVARGLPTTPSGEPLFFATLPQAFGSDHGPVSFSRTPLPPQPSWPARASGTTLATPSGTVVQLVPDHSVVLSEPAFGADQTYQEMATPAATISLRNSATGECIATATGAQRDTSVKVVAGDCATLQAQWRIHAPVPDPADDHDNSGAQIWENVAFPGHCLAAVGRTVTAAPCSQDASQRWWDNPVHIDSAWPEAASNVRLQSDWFDGRLRRAGSVPGTTTYTAQKPSWWWWIYWVTGQEKTDFGWTVERISPGDNIFRVVSLDGEGRCLGTQDEHAKPDALIPAVLRSCDDARGVDAAGQRWLAETYADGTIRLRNEANHHCLLGPDGESGWVRAASCDDTPAERWSIVDP
ncbi:MAG: hypothetical protein LBV34_01915, partial [Nocardiopsaceae bacterium]|nr:hypothetical protein [Nocardiopsaceae bacterium]